MSQSSNLEVNGEADITVGTSNMSLNGSGDNGGDAEMQDAQTNIWVDPTQGMSRIEVIRKELIRLIRCYSRVPRSTF